MNKSDAQQLINATRNWHHKFEIFPGLVTPGSYDPTFLLKKLGLPENLNRVTVLDVGPSDGFFSMALAKRGAKVTCVDYRAKDAHGFGAMEKISGLSFDYRQGNVYDITPQSLGTFDVVLFLGVLYHLPDMIKALNILRKVCNKTIFIETECEPTLMSGVAVARYYEGNSLAGDYTNFWAPNPECVQAMCRDSGFSPLRSDVWQRRMLLEAQCVPQSLKNQWAYGTL